MKTIKQRFLIMSFQYAVNVIGLPLYIDFWETKYEKPKSKFHK